MCCVKTCNAFVNYCTLFIAFVIPVNVYSAFRVHLRCFVIQLLNKDFILYRTERFVKILHRTDTVMMQKAQLSQRDRTRFLSLNILLSEDACYSFCGKNKTCANNKNCTPDVCRYLCHDKYSVKIINVINVR